MTQKLMVLVLVLGFTSASYAEDRSVLQTKCDAVEGDLSLQISCFEKAIQEVRQQNDSRLRRIQQNRGLAQHDLSDLVKNIGALRSATETRKSVYCSLVSAGSPFGGRGQALRNRECAFKAEQSLSEEISQIEKIVVDTIDRIENR